MTFSSLKRGGLNILQGRAVIRGISEFSPAEKARKSAEKQIGDSPEVYGQGASDVCFPLRLYTHTYGALRQCSISPYFCVNKLFIIMPLQEMDRKM
jgi:hypothetical protein